MWGLWASAGCAAVPGRARQLGTPRKQQRERPTRNEKLNQTELENVGIRSQNLQISFSKFLHMDTSIVVFSNFGAAPYLQDDPETEVRG